MALKFLFSVTDINSISYDVKFDDVTLEVSVWDAQDSQTFVQGATNPMLDLLMSPLDANGDKVWYIGTSAYPYARFPDAGHPLGEKCYGYDLYYQVADGNGREAQGTLKEANSTSCGYSPDIIITATVNNAVCYGSSTGNITLEVSGGTAPFTYLWNDGATTKDRLNMPAGTYSVTATDSLGFTKTLSNIFVSQNAQIEALASIGNNSIELAITGGIAPYTFSWTDGVTTQNRYEVSSGVYSVTVTDSVGCSATFTFTVSSERFYFSKNPVLLELQALSPATKPNLRFLCEVWVEPEYLSDNFVLATPEPFDHPADSSGATVFDVSEILDAFVEPHLPEFNQLTVARADKAFKRFYLRYTEVYGEPAVAEPFTVQDNRYVICGGLDAAEHYAGTYFSSFRPNRKPFLTWEPVQKFLFPSQPEYLYFVPESFDSTDFRVRVKVLYTDGGSTTYTVFVQEGIRPFEVYCIPVGHDQLSLAELQPERRIRSYDIYLIDSFNVIRSETRRFILDTRSLLHTRYFLYANSVGGYNSLAATGKAKLELSTKTQLLERHKPLDEQSADAVVTARHSTRTLACSTGHKMRGELLALQDFLNTEDVRLVSSDRYIPGRIADKTAEVMDETESMVAIGFDFVMSKMHRYTPALKLEGYTDETTLLTPLSP